MQEENADGSSNDILPPRSCAATNTNTTITMATSSVSHNSNNSNTVAAAAHSNYYDSYETVKIPERGTMKEHAIFGTLWGDTMIENYRVYRPKTNNAASNSTTTTVKDENRPSTATEHRAPVLVAYVKFGSHLNGHSGVVHGGILSLMFDDIMGFACGEVMMQQQQQQTMKTQHQRQNDDNGNDTNKNDDTNKQQQTTTTSTTTTTTSNQTIPVTANLNVDFRKPVLEGTKVRLEVNLEHREGRKLYWKARMFGDADDGKDKDVLYAEATSLYILINKK